MGKLKNMLGKRFGLLLVISRSTNDQEKKPRYFCKCDCGKTTITRGKFLRTGHAKSCGCLGYEARRKSLTKHGYCFSKTYSTWSHMLDRCRNKKDGGYRWYGGRGITVCERWLKFENFLADMGHKPKGHTIDRIDVNGNYEPGNCRWATPIEQANNTRGNIRLTYKGVTQSISDWARQLNIPRTTLAVRFYKGQTPEQILSKEKHVPAQVMFNGSLMTYPQIAKTVGMSYITLRWRIRKGLPLEKAIALSIA